MAKQMESILSDKYVRVGVIVINVLYFMSDSVLAAEICKH